MQYKTKQYNTSQIQKKGGKEEEKKHLLRTYPALQQASWYQAEE
jgi:hypothetical protein